MTDHEKVLSTSYFLGYELIAAEYCFDTVRVKTHKKKRIDKKWRKRYGYKRVPWKKLYITADGKIIGHPSVIDGLRMAIEMNKFV